MTHSKPFSKAYFNELFGSEERMGVYMGDYNTGEPLVSAEEYGQLSEHLKAQVLEQDILPSLTQEMYDALPEDEKRWRRVGEPVDENGEEVERATLLPDGTPMSVCTNNAHHVIGVLGTGKIYGFASEDNPALSQEVVDEYYHSDGHDFAVIDERFIVDPWISTFNLGSRETQLTYDLHDPADHAEIQAIYGDPACWKVLEQGEFIKPETPPSLANGEQAIPTLAKDDIDRFTHHHPLEDESPCQTQRL